MKFKVSFVLFGLVALIGCSNVAPMSNTPAFAQSKTPSPIAPTEFQFSTLTPRPTQQVTPTFNASQAITYTPGPTAECPKQTTDIIPVFKYDADKFCIDLETQVLAFLNAGGKIESVVTALPGASQIDLTNDGIPELAISECSFRVYSCEAGKYVKVLDMGDKEGYSKIINVEDMNLDGIPELIIGGGVYPFSNASTFYYRILEWNGEDHFQNLSAQPDFESRLHGSGVRNNWIYSEGKGPGVQSLSDNLKLADIDGDGTIEFVLNSGLPTSFDEQANGPWRAETTIFMWNGEKFLPYSIEAEPPQFRFQAVQDADYEAFHWNYEKALALYQQVISDSKLDWWSEQRQQHEVEVLTAQFNDLPVPTSLPMDNKEFANLSAYAYFRMMLVHIRRSDFSQAQIAYDTLQEKFPANQDGHGITEMAKDFWEEYRSSQSMSLACAKAVKYVKAHPKEFLNYLANVDEDYDIGKGIWHGFQSANYTPNDVCPF